MCLHDAQMDISSRRLRLASARVWRVCAPWDRAQRAAGLSADRPSERQWIRRRALTPSTVASPASAVALLLLVVAAPAKAQQGEDTLRPNAAYLEIFGNGGVYSFNYERALKSVRLRVGMAQWEAVDFLGSEGSTTVLTVPFTVHVLRGRGTNHLELGGGFLAGHRATEARFAGPSGSFVSLVGVLGYRRQHPEGRFVFRAGFTPFFGLGSEVDAYPDKGFLPSCGVSFGVAF